MPALTKRRVSDLVQAALALSARARRSTLPKVEIELDVFKPDGLRAVRLLTKDPGVTPR